MLLRKAMEKLHIKALNFKLVFLLGFLFAGLFSILVSKGAIEAQDETYKRMYALRVETGPNSDPGDVGTFVVVYKDTDKQTRRAYINPHDGDYVNSINFAVGKGMDANVQKKMDSYKAVAGYNVPWMDSLSTAKSETDSNNVALSPNSIDTYFFQTYYEVDEILALGVMTGDSDTLTKSWTCYGISLYKVYKAQGVVPYGYISNTYELGFYGALLNRMEFKENNGSPIAQFDFSRRDVKYIYADKESEIGKTTTASFPRVTGESYSNLDFAKDQYTIKLDVADVYKAGFEDYVAGNEKNAKLSDVKPAEILVLNLDYWTTSRNLRTVNLPVLSSALAYAIETGAITADTPLADLLPQGGSIAFTAKLPEFSEISNATLYYVSGEKKELGDVSLEALTGMTSKKDYAEKHKKYYDDMKNDRISFTGVQIYPGTNAVDVTLGDTAALVVKENAGAKMLYQMSAPVHSGYPLDTGAGQKLEFEPVRGNPIKTADNRSLFILETKTSDLANSGTASDIAAVIRYIDRNDEEKQVEFRFKESAKEFYGYWPDDMGDDAGYQLSMNNSASYYALFEADNVKRFIGMTLANKGKDDWMAESIAIYQVDDNSKLGGVCYQWNSDSGIAKVIHGRTINGRPLNYKSDLGELTMMDKNIGVTLLVSIGNGEVSDSPDVAAGIFIGGEKEREISFTSIEVGKQKDNRTNFFEYYYDMPYDVAHSNFGFDTKAVAYTVEVQVDSDPYGIKDGLRYDDCGSANYFYFQLLFERGNSAYVQANQQMRGDGFRTGVIETFDIYVNQEYGALQGIKIIPEVDINTGKPYDKLNIKQIEVKRSTDNGLKQSFKTDTIGWIGIDYSDDGGKQKYHKSSQLAKIYPFVKESNTATILFALGYDSIPEELNQFQGTVTASITYKDTAGKTQVEEYDIVKAMHKFNGTLGIADLSERTSKDGKEKLVKSDPNLMFRPNHTDRFLWEKSDLKYVEKITLEATNSSNKTVFLDVTNFSMTVLRSSDLESNRAINRYGEYIIEGIEYDENNVTWCKEGLHELKLNTDTTGSIIFEFEYDENTCISVPDSSKFPYIVTRQPESYNDTVNVYAYVSPTTTDLSKLRVSGVVTYDDTASIEKHSPDEFRLTTITDENGNRRQVFCCEDLLVRNFRTLKDIGLVAYGKGNVAIEYVIVQHIRNNVVINCYKAKFAVKDPSINDSMVYTDPGRISLYNNIPGYQDITIQFGDNMEATTLTPEHRDLAISFDYLFGITSDEYHTENYFLTDSGARTIKPGETITLRVYGANIGRINGISLTAAEFLDLDIKAVTIGVYTPIKSQEGQETTYECTDWYSVECNTKLKNEMKNFKVSSDQFDSADTWSPITMQIKTLASYVAENGSLGVDLGLTQGQKLKMVVTYDDDGTLKELVFDDIVNRLRSGDFSAGKTAEFVFLAKNLRAENIRSIAFKPYDDDPESNVFWGLDSVSVAFGDGVTAKSTIYVEPRRILYEDDEKPGEISFSKVILSADVQKVEVEYEDEENQIILFSKLLEDYGTIKQDSNIKINLVNHSASDIFKIKVNLQNSSMSYLVEEGPGFVRYQTDGEVLYFSFDGNVTDEKTIRISSIENPESFLDITFVIISKEEPETPPEDPSEGPGEPEDPADPVDPENPAEPVEPEDPSEPEDPDENGDPEEPGETE